MRRVAICFLFASLTLSAQTKKILVQGAPPERVRELQALTTKAQIVGVNKENLAEHLADADAFIGNITPDQVRAGKNLKWVQVQSAGVEGVLHLAGSSALRDSAIVLTNNQIVQGPEIADHAMAMLLSLARRLPTYIADRQAENWRRGERYQGIELNGRTAVIVGVGGIGSQIAFRAWAHGMRVIGVDPEDIPFMPILHKVVKPDQIDEVLPEADVLFISAPHTPQSHRMIGSRQFDLMKKDSYFIAVSRGAIYDLNGLVRALDSKHLAGAGVDVTDPEPLPKGHALWKFDNVIITPHIAGRSDKDAARMNNTVKENIVRFADGRPLINVVDKQKGY